jgi:hypothetical protein
MIEKAVYGLSAKEIKRQVRMVELDSARRPAQKVRLGWPERRDAACT